MYAPILLNMSMSDSAFHEKAGPCQGILWLCKFISDVFLLRGSLPLSAELKLSSPFHPHSFVNGSYARCTLGVLDTVGAAIC